MPYSSSLSDNEWEIIAPRLPKKKQTRPPKWTKRQILDGVFYQSTKERLQLGGFAKGLTAVVDRNCLVSIVAPTYCDGSTIANN